MEYFLLGLCVLHFVLHLVDKKNEPWYKAFWKTGQPILPIMYLTSVCIVILAIKDFMV